jgi:hypothetical protein
VVELGATDTLQLNWAGAPTVFAFVVVHNEASFATCSVDVVGNGDRSTNVGTAAEIGGDGGGAATRLLPLPQAVEPAGATSEAPISVHSRQLVHGSFLGPGQHYIASADRRECLQGMRFPVLVVDQVADDAERVGDVTTLSLL